MLLQEGNLTCTSFHPHWNDVVQDELVIVKEGKLAHVSFPPRWNNVIRYALVIVQEGKLACPQGAKMFFGKRLCLCKMKS
jgi:hypothetical protein